MKILFEQGAYKFCEDFINAPLPYYIMVDHKGYEAKDRKDGLIYFRGFKTLGEMRQWYKENKDSLEL